MNVLFTEALSPDQEAEIRRLTADCRASFPEECDGWWLVTDADGAICSFLFLCRVGEERWEGTPFTPASFRRRGYFSSILRAACREDAIPGEGELVFPVWEDDRETRAVMEAIGAECVGEERLMEKEILGAGSADSTPSLSDAASFSLEVYGETACLYDFSVRPELRNRGIGRAVLEQLFARLAEEGVKRLRLQVSGDNAPALALYEKTGFRTAETLLYFLY